MDEPIYYVLIPDEVFYPYMPIKDYLLPEEKILFWSDFLVTHDEIRYKTYITDLRLILYSQTGLLFKKEDVITEIFNKITGLQFTEQGTIKKKGVLRFNSNKGEISLEGPVNGMRGLFKAIQKQMLNPYSQNPFNDPDYE